MSNFQNLWKAAQKEIRVADVHNEGVFVKADTGHAVLITDYKEQGGVQYFLIKNSWGNRGGVDYSGYVWMETKFFDESILHNYWGKLFTSSYNKI